MPDATERLLRKIRLGEDSFLELEEAVFAGGRIKGDQRQLFWPVGGGAIGEPLDGPGGV